MLSFIYQGTRTKKFVMKFGTAKTKENIERWMESIHEHIIQGKPYHEDEEGLMEWFSEDLMDKMFG